MQLENSPLDRTGLLYTVWMPWNNNPLIGYCLTRYVGVSNEKEAVSSTVSDGHL